MQYILLSGGSGKRLWPLSNDINSKQFIKFFKTENGSYESMVQRVYRQILASDPSVCVTVATSKSQVSLLRSQLGDGINICVEPDHRDTFPAIALASAYLHDVKGISEDEAVVVCPVDPYVDNSYFATIENMRSLVQNGKANIALMGIEPTRPSEEYGYIIPTDKSIVSRVDCFKEKPDAETAKAYIKEGALWNGGVFAFKIGHVLAVAHELIDFSGYKDLLRKYSTLQKISFDYAVVEREKDVTVIRYNGVWLDLGTWKTLTEVMPDSTMGNVRVSGNCENVHVVNRLDVPVLCVGLKNTVVAVSPEGVLVSDKPRSGGIKPYVDDICQPVMFADKSWGSFQVIDVERDSLTAKITLLPEHQIRPHSHPHCKKTWTVVSGKGSAIVDDTEIALQPGATVQLPAGSRHSVVAQTIMTIIECQIGEDISTEALL